MAFEIFDRPLDGIRNILFAFDQNFQASRNGIEMAKDAQLKTLWGAWQGRWIGRGGVWVLHPCAICNFLFG